MRLPSSLPYPFVAGRLATPRALLGVVIAEYLATGFGLGGLRAASRGKLAYGMSWSIAITVAVVSVALYLGLAALKRRVLRRFGAGHADAVGRRGEGSIRSDRPLAEVFD